MTEDEIRIIAERVSNIIKKESVMIDQLDRTNVLSNTDLLELDKGRCVSLDDLRSFIRGTGIFLEIITKDDNKTVPSDSNIMSALRTLAEIKKFEHSFDKLFLRKDQDDKTEFVLSMLGALIGSKGKEIKFNPDGTITPVGGKLVVNGNIWATGEITAHMVGDSEPPVPDTPGGLDTIQMWRTLGASTNEQINISHLENALLGYVTLDALMQKGYLNETEVNTLLKQKADVTYVNKKISDLVNGAPETLDTLKEIADALSTNKSVVDALNSAIGNKADKVHTHAITDIVGLLAKLNAYDTHVGDKVAHITASERLSWNNKLDKTVWDNVFYQDAQGIHVRVNLIGDKEVSAYGLGDTQAPSGVLDLVNSLTSDRTDAALTAAMGKELKRQIDTKTVDLTGYATVEWVKQQKYITGYINNYLTGVWGSGNGTVYFYRQGLEALSFNFAHTHPEYLTEHQSLAEYYKSTTVDSLLAAKASTVYVNQKIADLIGGAPETLDTLKEIADALANNKNAMDAINAAIGNKLDKSVWNDVFYTDARGIHVKVNLIGDKEVSAYGIGETQNPTGVIDIINSLVSDRQDAALSAAMGKELKRQIDSKTIDLTGYVTQTWVQQQGYITGYVNNYVNNIWGSGNGMLYLYRQGLQTLSVDLSHTHSEYLTQHQSLAEYYKSAEVDKLLGGKSNVGHTHSQYLTSHQKIDHLASKDGSNATGTWGISITGNAKTATSADKVKSFDNRAADELPSAKVQGLTVDFKSNTANKLKDGGEFNTVLNIRGYGDGTDFTGGYPTQLAFTQNGNFWIRTAKDANTWNAWGKIWTGLNFNPEDYTQRRGRYQIYTDNKTPYNFVHLFRVANKTAWSCLRLDIDIKSRYYAAKLYLDLYCNEHAFGDGVTYFTTSQNCVNGRKAEIYIKRTNQATDYNYYDVYIKSGSWDKGYYDIISQGGNGTMVFEHKGKRLDTLPDGCAKIEERLHVNGPITATGEITAHLDTAKTLEETPMLMSLNDCDVYDGLDSMSTDIPLSANQGRVLAEQIRSLQKQINKLIL